MAYGLTYKNVHSDSIGVTIRTEPSILPPIQVNTIQIPGMPGAYYQSSEIGMRQINVPVGLIFTDASDYQSRLRDLAQWLSPEKDIHDMPLVFDMEDKTYYAILTGNTDLQKIARTGQGTLNFIAPDPLAYGQETTPQTINDPTGGNVNTIVTNDGTAEALPIFTAPVQKPITFLDIIAPDAYMRVGQPYTVEQTPFEAETLILHDTMSTTTGWGAGDAVDHGVITGTMTSDGDSFIVSDFGADASPATWQGPALKKSFSESLQDFKMDVLVSITNIGYQTGIAEIYLKDSANNTVGKISLGDSFVGNNKVTGRSQIGGVNGPVIADASSYYENEWNNFDGIIRLQRKGNVLTAYFALVDQNGIHYTRNNQTYVDVNNSYMVQVTQIQVALRKWTGTTACPMKVKDIKVWKLNTPGTDQIPYIAVAGDVLTFDHTKALILKNGEPFMSEKDFGATFFRLIPGQTELAVRPSDGAIVTEKHKPRWL